MNILSLYLHIVQHRRPLARRYLFQEVQENLQYRVAQVIRSLLQCHTPIRTYWLRIQTTRSRCIWSGRLLQRSQ